MVFPVVKMSSNVRLPPISLDEGPVGQRPRLAKAERESLPSIYTSTMKLSYQQPTQYPGSVLRAIAAYFRSEIKFEKDKEGFLRNLSSKSSKYII